MLESLVVGVQSLTDLQVWCPWERGCSFPSGPALYRTLWLLNGTSVLWRWNFFKSLCFPVGYPYIPSFQAQEFWSELRLEGFCFVIPMKCCCFLGKICSFFFFLHNTFLKNIFSNHSKLPTSLKGMKNRNKQNSQCVFSPSWPWTPASDLLKPLDYCYLMHTTTPVLWCWDAQCGGWPAVPGLEWRRRSLCHLH